MPPPVLVALFVLLVLPGAVLADDRSVPAALGRKDLAVTALNAALELGSACKAGSIALLMEDEG